jgi:hypothetical protein
MNRPTHLAALLLALACLAPLAQAQWVWKDARGQVHASDLPPPRDVPAKDILTRPEAAAQRKPAAAPAAASGPATGASAVAVANPAAAKPRTDPELEARRKKQEQEQASRQKADDDKQAAARADNCQRARSHLATLEQGTKVVRVNDKGEREVLDDKARADEVARARQVVASDCKSAL